MSERAFYIDIFNISRWMVEMMFVVINVEIYGEYFRILLNFYFRWLNGTVRLFRLSQTHMEYIMSHFGGLKLMEALGGS